MTRKIVRSLPLVLLCFSACQPLCGLRAEVRSERPIPDDAPLRIALDVAPRLEGVPPEEPQQQTVTRTDGGFLVQISWYEPSVSVAMVVWADLDGDGQRGPDEPSAELPRTELDGAGCDGVRDVGVLTLR